MFNEKFWKKYSQIAWSSLSRLNKECDWSAYSSICYISNFNSSNIVHLFIEMKFIIEKCCEKKFQFSWRNYFCRIWTPCCLLTFHSHADSMFTHHSWNEFRFKHTIRCLMNLCWYRVAGRSWDSYLKSVDVVGMIYVVCVGVVWFFYGIFWIWLNRDIKNDWIMVSYSQKILIFVCLIIQNTKKAIYINVSDWFIRLIENIHKSLVNFEWTQSERMAHRVKY